MLGSIFKRSATVTSGTPDVYDDFWYGVVGAPTSSGKTVNTSTAMQLWAVNACVTLIASSIASLPLKLKRPRSSGGTEDAKEHRLYRLLKVSPNREMSSFTFREMLLGNLLCRGNGYSYINRSGYDVKSLHPIPQPCVTPKRIKDLSDADRVKNGIGPKDTFYYEVRLGKSDPWPVPMRDMLHVRAFSFDGIESPSPITQYAKQVVGNGIALDEFQGQIFKNGVHTSGVLEHPETLGENKDLFLDALENRYASGRNIGRPMVLEKGMKFNQIKVSMVDQQFLEQRKANALEICGMFHVPPSKIAIYGQGTSYNNTEQQNKNFIDDTLMPWVVRLEQEMERMLLTPLEINEGYSIKFNFDALLRPDGKTRAEIDQMYFGMGVPVNDMRARDDLPPVQGGDQGYIPLNYAPIGQSYDASEPRNLDPENRATHQTKTDITEERQERSIKGRGRVSNRFYPLLEDAAKRVVDFEVKEIRAAIEKHTGQRGKREFGKWVRKFYDKEMPSYIEKHFQSVFFAYSEAISILALREVGGEFDPAEHDKFIAGYIDVYVKRHIGSSTGQLYKILEAADFAEELSIRVGEWGDKRAFKIAANERTRLAAAVTYNTYSMAGVKRVKWVAIGESCPFCRTMNGRTQKIGEPFMKKNSVLYVDEETGKTSFYDPDTGKYTDKIGESKSVVSMKSTGTKFHAPLHQKCDCTIVAA